MVFTVKTYLINSLRESKSNGAYILLWNTFSEKRRKLWRLKTLIKKVDITGTMFTGAQYLVVDW